MNRKRIFISIMNSIISTKYVRTNNEIFYFHVVVGVNMIVNISLGFLVDRTLNGDYMNIKEKFRRGTMYSILFLLLKLTQWN